MSFQKICDTCEKEIVSSEGGSGFSEWCLFHHTKRRDFCSSECFIIFIKKYFVLQTFDNTTLNLITVDLANALSKIKEMKNENS